MRIWMIMLMIVLASCNDNQTVAPSVDKKQSEEMEVANRINTQVDSTIEFKFLPDSSTLTATGSIKSQLDHVIGILPVDRNGKLTADLIPEDDNLNIRFSQLITPDGKMDGPFGRQINYTINRKGVYKIIMAPSNMAEGKVKGKFTVRLSFK